MDLNAIEAEAIAAEQHDYDDREANQSEVVRKSKRTHREKQIVAQYVGMLEIELLKLNFGRAADVLKLAEREMLIAQDPANRLLDPIDAIPGLRTAQLAILQCHGFYFLHQFDGRSLADLRDLENVGPKTVATVGDFMSSIEYPMPSRRAVPTAAPSKYAKPAI